MQTPLRLRGISRLVLVAALIGILSLNNARAASYTWLGAGGDDLWSTADNWNPDAAPPNDGTADLQFDGAVRLTPNTDTAYNIDSLTFNSTAGAFILGGGQITLGVGGLTQNSVATETINNALVLGAAQTWNVNAGALNLGSTATLNTGGYLLTVNAASGAGATFNGAISGTGGLTLSGTVTLAGANSYSGTTTVSGGSLLVTGSLNGTTGTALTFANSGSFNANEAAGASQVMKGLTFSAGQGTVQSTYGGSGNTTLTFSAKPTRTAGASGNFAVSGGANGSTNRITFTTAPTAGALLDKGVYFNGADYAAYDAGGFVRAFSYSGDSTGVTSPGGSGTTTFLTSATFASGSTLSSSSNVNMTGSISAQGTQAINTLKMSNNSSLGLATSATLTLSGILQAGNVAGGATISGGTAIKPTSGAELVIRTDGVNDALTISTPILANGTNAFTKTGAGTLTLTATDTYTGATYVDAGTLVFGTSGKLSAGGNVNVAAGGTLNINGGTLNPTTRTLTLEGSGVSPANATVITGTMSFRSEVIGNYGVGAFAQSGGTNTVGSSLLYLGNNAGSSGSYGLSGGSLSASAAYVGDYGNGSFVQTGGGVTLTNANDALHVAEMTGSNASYALSGGGTISAYQEYIGVTGSGSFTQTGGTNTISGNSHGLVIGYADGGSGSYKQSGGTTTVSTQSVTVGNTSGSVGSYALSGTGALIASTESIGYQGLGSFTQTGGTNTLVANQTDFGSLTIGDFGGTGSYRLDGGTLTAPIETIGNYSTGRFVQNGGLNTSSVGLTLGSQSGGYGTYALNGGTLKTGAVNGGGSTGIFDFNGGTLQASASYSVFVSGLTAAYVQAGGAFIDTNNRNPSIPQGLSHDPALGATPDGGLTKKGAGTLTLTGANTYTGSTSVQAGTLAFGDGGSLSAGGAVNVASGATLQISGGSLTLPSKSLTLDGTVANPANASVIAGTMAFSSEFIGNTGVGAFTQSSGAHTVGDSGLSLGYGAGSTGTYSLSGDGTLTAGNEYIGDSGVGTFTQTGGTNTVSSSLTIGRQSGSVGTYTLGGGTNTVSGNLTIGGQSGSVGTYTLSGGTLQTASTSGGSGSGTFNFNGGTLQAASDSTDFMSGLTAANVQQGGARIDSNGYNISIPQGITHDPTVGDGPDGGLTKLGTGTVTLTGANAYTGGTSVQAGTLSFGVGGSLSSGGDVSVAAGATLEINGGNLTLPGSSLTVDGSADFPAIASVIAGSLQFSSEFIGYNNVGAFTQSGGDHTVGGYGLSVGYGVGSNGSYNLSGGTLTASGEYIGTYGVGAFTQSGGTNTLSGSSSTLYVGYGSGGSGSYNLGGEGAMLSTPNEIVGLVGPGVFTQSGGTHNVTGSLNIGEESSGLSAFNLSGGTLTAGSEVIGASGVGTFTQTGGAHTVNGDMELASDYGAGNYNLSGASATLSAAGEMIGYVGTGTFTQTGGSNTVGADGLNLGYLSGGSGSYNLSGTGSLTAANESIGGYGSGDFVQNGGTNTVFVVVTLGGLGNGGPGTYTLNGGVLEAAAVNGGAGTGTFNFNGGTLRATTSSASFVSGLTSANVQAGGAMIDTNGKTPIISQVLSHDQALGETPDGGLTKLGTGTLTLTGANTYTGPTQVNAGTLLIDNMAGSGTGSGTVTVNNNGSTLGGEGVVAGRVIVSSGAILQGGSGGATGALTLQSDLTLSTGSTIQLALDSSGAHSSLARVGSGAWSFADGQEFAFINPQAGSYDGIITGLAADPGNEGNWTVTSAGFNGSFEYDGEGNIDLNLAAVPESSTWLASAFVVFSGAIGWKRSQRRTLQGASKQQENGLLVHPKEGRRAKALYRSDLSI